MHLLGFKVHWLGSWTCREAARTPKTKQMHGRCAHRNQKHKQMHGRCAHYIFLGCTPTVHLQTFKNLSFENVLTYCAFAAFHGPPMATLLFSKAARHVHEPSFCTLKPSKCMVGVHNEILWWSKTYRFLIIKGSESAHLPCVCKVEFWKCSDLLCICDVYVENDPWLGRLETKKIGSTKNWIQKKNWIAWFRDQIRDRIRAKSDRHSGPNST